MAFGYSLLVPKAWSALAATSLDNGTTRHAKAFLPGAPRAAAQHVVLPNGETIFLPGTGNRTILTKGQFTFQILLTLSTYDLLEDEIKKFGDLIGKDGTLYCRAAATQTDGGFSCDCYLITMDILPPFQEAGIKKCSLTMVMQALTDWENYYYLPTVET